MKVEAEKPDFTAIYCFECDRPVREYKTVFFLEKESDVPRYGAICKKCLKSVNNRKIFVLSGDDVIMRPGKVIEDAFQVFKKKRKRR